MNVIPMRMADEDVAACRRALLVDELPAELVCAGAAVKDQERTDIGSQFNARSITPVANCGLPRLSDRPASSPKSNLHVGLAMN